MATESKKLQTKASQFWTDKDGERSSASMLQALHDASIAHEQREVMRQWAEAVEAHEAARKAVADHESPVPGYILDWANFTWDGVLKAARAAAPFLED